MSVEQTYSDRAIGLSAATGKPHFFALLYVDDGKCVWCGHPPSHDWHLKASA